MPEAEMGDAIVEAHQPVQHRHRRDRGTAREGRAGGEGAAAAAAPRTRSPRSCTRSTATEFRERYLTEGQEGPQRGARRVQGEDQEGVPARGRDRAEVHRRRRCRRRDRRAARARSSARSPSAAPGSTAARRRSCGTSPARSPCCRGRTARPCSSAARRRRSSSPRSAPSPDEQKVDGLQDEYSKKFMLDYNFPPFSVGECKPIRGPGRREIGHGMLAERSLKAVIPPADASSRTRSASSPRSWSRTGRAAWRACAAGRWR